MNRVKILKSLHVLSGVAVHLFDRDFNLVKSFKSNQARILDYNFKAMCNGEPLEPGHFGMVMGNFNELFILYGIDEQSLLFGPFRCNVVDRDLLTRKLSEQGARSSDCDFLYEYLKSLPLFALGDVRDIMIHINFCFTGEMVDPLSKDLHEYVRTFYVELDHERMRKYDTRRFEPEVYLFYYESEIMQYVKNGKVGELKEMIYRLSNAVVPNSVGDVMRSEKTYSVVVFEKLSRAAIESGMDIIDSGLARDSFICRTEQCESLKDILKVRDAAIVYFTAEVGKMRTRGYSHLISSIIQFIGLNTNRPLRTQEIADAFHLSVSATQKKFKAETGITIQQYILERKISEAKVMLKSGLSVTETSVALGFFDSSHFSRMFKKVMGMSPKRYQIQQPPTWKP